jgi:ammonia channel protein AmtB
LILRSFFGLRADDDQIEEGLDLSSHGQSGYKL